jgi:transposase
VRHDEVCRGLHQRGTVRGSDYAHWHGYVEAFFQLHGVDASEQVALRRQLTRAQVLPFFERLPAMEACGAGHHWARELRRLGHEVRLIAPQLAQPYVARGKNDTADAAALCEAASRPQMRFVPAKTADQQAL